KPSMFVQSGPNVDYMRKWYTAAYVADTWKLNQRWTLNYGLRWEPDLAETLTLGYVAKYSEQARAAGVRSTVFQKAPLGFSFPGDPGFQGKRGRDRNCGSLRPGSDSPGMSRETAKHRSGLQRVSDMTIRTRSTICGRRSFRLLARAPQSSIRFSAIHGRRREQDTTASTRSR